MIREFQLRGGDRPQKQGRRASMIVVVSITAVSGSSSTSIFPSRPLSTSPLFVCLYFVLVSSRSHRIYLGSSHSRAQFLSIVPTATAAMATLGPNAQKRYYQQPPGSSTRLLSPSPGPSPAPGLSPTLSPGLRPVSPGTQAVQAALAQTPRSVRSMASNATIVRTSRHRSPLLFSSHLL